MPSDMSCESVAEVLSSVVDGAGVADAAMVTHIDSCLRCQAELVQYRKLLRALHQLRTQVLQPSPGLFTDILASLEEAGEKRAIRSLLHGRRAAYLGGIAAAATAAGAAGAIVLASRARQRKGIRLAG